MSKESTYDERINPLMTQIIDICKESGIAMIASFSIPTSENPNLACTTAIPDETGAQPPHHLLALDDIRGSRSATFAIVTSRQEQP